MDYSFCLRDSEGFETYFKVLGGKVCIAQTYNGREDEYTEYSLMSLEPARQLWRQLVNNGSTRIA
jgi:hypothetical protein